MEESLPVDVLLARGEIKDLLQAYGLNELDPPDCELEDLSVKVRIATPNNNYEALIFGYDPETSLFQAFFTLNHDHQMAEIGLMKLTEAVQKFGLRLDETWQPIPLRECSSYLEHKGSLL